jgi:hypothetical protein
MPSYEVWHTETNQHVGTQEVRNPIEHSEGVRVMVFFNGHIEVNGETWKGIQMLVTQMKESLDKDAKKYYALETNLDMKLLKHLEGFTPKVIIPTITDIFAINRGLRGNRR